MQTAAPTPRPGCVAEGRGVGIIPTSTLRPQRNRAGARIEQYPAPKPTETAKQAGDRASILHAPRTCPASFRRPWPTNQRPKSSFRRTPRLQASSSTALLGRYRRPRPRYPSRTVVGTPARRSTVISGRRIETSNRSAARLDACRRCRSRPFARHSSRTRSTSSSSARCRHAAPPPHPSDEPRARRDAHR